MNINDYFRNEFQTELRILCSDLFNETPNWEARAILVVETLENFMKQYSPETLEEIIGNTFPFANGNNVDKTQIPLYLYMELIADIIEKQYRDNPKYIGRNLDSLISRFRDLREKTIAYSNNEKFDPKKHLSKGLVNDIIRSKGFISLGSTRVGDRTVISIECTETRERHRMRKDGEYEPLESNDYQHTHPCLYEEDAIEYREQQERENKEIRENFNAVTGKYFTEGYLPLSTHEFNEKLKDKNIHPNILSILRTISENRKKFPDGSKGELAWMKDCQRYLRGIKKLEEEKRQQEIEPQEDKKSETIEEPKRPPTKSPSNDSEEERKLAVKAARKRYAEQNPLLQWYREVTGQQKRFDAIEFDDLSLEEINALYTDSGKRKK